MRLLFRKWRESRSASLQLDAILAAADPDAPLAERNAWLVELGYWLRRDGNPGVEQDGDASAARRYPEHVRLRYLLQVLARHPEWSDSFARTVRAIVRDNDPTALFCDTGVASHPGIWGEMVDRLQARFLPPPPNRSDMAALFALLFVDDNDAEWVEALDNELVERLGMAVLSDADEGVERFHVAREATLTTSIQVLVSHVKATGLSQAIRSRLHGRVEDTPFYRLDTAIVALCEEGLAHDGATFAHRLNYFRALLDGCHAAARQVYDDL